MKIAVLGINGYIGWPLALHLIQLGHEVGGFDNDSKSDRMKKVGAISAIPVQPLAKRAAMLRMSNADIAYGDIMHYDEIHSFLKSFQPETIINLAQQPSAPYSMIDVYSAVETQTTNAIGSLNLLWAIHNLNLDTHLITLGTMGEYGTPPTEIPEGFFEVDFRGKKANFPFPKAPGSIYHASKVMASVDVAMLTRIWSLQTTDVMQGVVYGTRTEEINSFPMATYFAFDETFGTAINRFCAQAVIGMPLTPYGAGGQKRGFLSLTDSIQCLSILSEHPAERGKYRVVNQLDDVYSVTQLANMVVIAASKSGLESTVEAYTPNPRKELEEHDYKVDHDILPSFGFQPEKKIEDELEDMIHDLIPWKDRIHQKRSVIAPKTTWLEGRRNVIATA